MSDRLLFGYCTRRRSGQALVETALVLPVVALLLMGLIEASLLLYAHVQVANAAREAGRAASLYRSTRYAGIDANNPPNCDTGTEGWSILQVVSQAVVTRQAANNGCPNTSGSILGTSLGRLPAVSSPAWTASVSPAQASGANPAPGSVATVELRYPYRLVLLSGLLPMFNDPIWITKRVQIIYQQ